MSLILSEPEPDKLAPNDPEPCDPEPALDEPESEDFDWLHPTLGCCFTLRALAVRLCGT